MPRTKESSEIAKTRSRAKAKSKSSTEEAQAQGSTEESFEQEDVGKTLHAKDGRLGFVSKKGFLAATNFLVDIGSQVYSEKYSFKGQFSKYYCSKLNGVLSTPPDI